MDIKDKSILMKEKRQKYLVEQLNPHEKEMMEFIKEVVAEYNINNIEEWNKYEDLIPDCVSKTLMYWHYEKEKSKSE